MFSLELSQCENWSTWRKNELTNNKHKPHMNDEDTGSWAQTTLVSGECFHHCTTLAIIAVLPFSERVLPVHERLATTSDLLGLFTTNHFSGVPVEQDKLKSRSTNTHQPTTWPVLYTCIWATVSPLLGLISMHSHRVYERFNPYVKDP